MEKHTIEAFYQTDSKILILGSFPSVKSREEGFYYAHPQNRFWKVLGALFQEEIGNSKSLKQDFLKRHHIALFDVCASCNIKGSSDASIKDVIPNDLSKILKASSIKAIFLNGKTASKLFHQFQKDIKIPVFELPSTSPANAIYHLEDLIEVYQILLSYV